MEMPSAWLMCSAVSCDGSSGADWTWLCLAQGSPWLPPTEASPAAPLAATLQSTPKTHMGKCNEKILKIFGFNLS